MDRNKRERRISRGAGRWQAPRMKPIVKKLSTKKVKKAPAKKASSRKKK